MKKKEEKAYVYIITNVSMPGICKVGRATDVEDRLKGMYNTSVPIKFQIYEKFELEDMAIAGALEQEIFEHFKEQRINPRREFLWVHPQKVRDFASKIKNTVKTEIESEIKSKFGKLGIKEGSILKFTYGGEIYDSIMATVGKGNSITYGSIKRTSLSKASLKVLEDEFGKKWKSAQGTLYWTHNGKTIRELMDKKDAEDLAEQNTGS